LDTVLREDDIEAWLWLVDPENARHRRDSTAAGSASPPHRPEPPQVSGPISAMAAGDPSRDYPQMASWLPLANDGYVEEEYFISGRATSYAMPGINTAVALSTDHPYTTRMVVRRPLTQRRFNGTVVIEWLNVSASSNIDFLWLEAAQSLVAHGYAYIGVSVQRAGVHAPDTGLRAWSPRRYGSLDVTGGGAILDDSLCYDIFSQAALAARSPAGIGPIGPLAPQRVVAFGASQSHRRLANYYNGLQQRHDLFDGFLMAVGRGGTAVRGDGTTPVIKVNSETDVLSAGYEQVPDSTSLCTWEVAGASHTTYRLAVSRAVVEARGDVPPIPYSLCERPPLSRIPLHHAITGALARLDEWITSGLRPPSAPEMRVEERNGSRLAVRDERGNVLGGLRLPQHEVATAVNTGVNHGPGLLALCGTHIPFAPDQLVELYGNTARYRSLIRQAAQRSVAVGYILDDAANQAAAEAENVIFGTT